MKTSKQENMILNSVKSKKMFKHICEYLELLDSTFYGNGLGHLFTEKEMRKLHNAVQSEQINKVALAVIGPQFEMVKDFSDQFIFNINYNSDVLLSQLVNMKTFTGGSNNQKGLIEILKDSINKLLLDPAKKTKKTLKKRTVVKVSETQFADGVVAEDAKQDVVEGTTQGKKPRASKVFTLQGTELLVKPNQQTWEALLKLEKAYDVLVLSGVEKNKNKNNLMVGTQKKGSLSEQLEMYKNLKVLLKAEDDNIQQRANDLAERFSTYLDAKTQMIFAKTIHNENVRLLAYLKGLVKKSEAKSEQIADVLSAQNKSIDDVVIPTTQIAGGRTK